MRSMGSGSRITRRQAATWADRALADIYETMERPLTLTEACDRAVLLAATAWVDAEQRRTGKPVQFPT